MEKKGSQSAIGSPALNIRQQTGTKRKQTQAPLSSGKVGTSLLPPKHISSGGGRLK